MKNLLFILSIYTFIVFGCKNVKNGEMSSEETVVGKENIDTTAVDSHTSENSLDWAGVYEGTTPCADCEGIKTVLELKENKTYTLSMTYLGRPKVDPIEGEGEFSWDQTGSKITLKTNDQPMQLKVGENQVWMLNGDGNVVEGELADFYILRKKL